MTHIKNILSIFMAAIIVMAGVLGNVTAKAAVVQTVPTISRIGLGHTLVAGDIRVHCLW